MFTPPLTSGFSQRHEPEPMEQEPDNFHTYLRAFHHYHPASTISSGDEGESSVTVPINQGDVILVHSVQPNGWADGTLLVSGARGWLPTNYCEAYDHPAIHDLMESLTHVWEFIRGHEDDAPSVFMGQDYVRGMIAGVRVLLERTDCLNRDDPMLQASVPCRRARRAILGELATFVKTTKSLQELCRTGSTSDKIYDLLDDIVLKAFKVVTRAVKFLDSWLQHAELEQNAQPRDSLLPPTPSSAGFPAHPSAEANADGPVGTHPQIVNTPAAPPSEERPQAAQSSTSNAGLLGSTAQESNQQTSLAQKRVSACHRWSYSVKSPTLRQQDLASERLSTAHDGLLGALGNLTGLHLHARSSFELLTRTQQALAARETLMAVVEEVFRRDNCRSKTLDDAKDALDSRIVALVQVTTRMPSFDDAEGYVPNREQSIMDAVMLCVRSAGDCVAKTKTVIQRIGDFEFDGEPPTGLGISNTSNAFDHTLAGQTEVHAQSPMNEGFEVIGKPLPSPPNSPKHTTVAAEQTLPPMPVAMPPAPPISSTSTNSFTAEAREALPRVSSDTVVRRSISTLSAPASSTRLFPSLDLHIPPSSPITFPENSAMLPQSSSLNQSPKSASEGTSVGDANSTYLSSLRFSEMSERSVASTLATTPDHSPVKQRFSGDLKGSFGSLAESRSTIADDYEDAENSLLTTTYAHELSFNKDGQLTGGSLPALVERLTSHDSTPDAMFVNTFYLTFRLFCDPAEFSQCLIDRFDYIGANLAIATPVRLRVYNVLKGWLEMHWRNESDSEALKIIVPFANGPLKATIPSASKKLVELTEHVARNADSGKTRRVISLQGKTNTVIGSTVDMDSPMPAPIISKSQLNLLKKCELKGTTCSILDFEPLELARQFTLIESKIFCMIGTEELLASEWMKKTDSKAVHVKAMSTLSTGLANLVVDTILQHEEAKKRAIVVKQWIKIAKKCRELNNYDSLMAIVCSLNSSMINRLKKTWELVSEKTLKRLEELRNITDCSRNFANLRQLLQNHVAPCLPFVGTYLTDLTFVDIGNQTKRQMPRGGRSSPSVEGAEAAEDCISLINFDKQVKTAKIIGDLQRFQIPYRLTPVPEMQDWMEAQINRMRSDEHANLSTFYRRSCLLEPREQVQAPQKPSPIDTGASSSFSSTASGGSAKEKDGPTTRERFEQWTALYFAMSSKERVAG